MNIELNDGAIISSSHRTTFFEEGIINWFDQGITCFDLNNTDGLWDKIIVEDTNEGHIIIINKLDIWS